MIPLALLVPCYNASKYVNTFIIHLKSLNFSFAEIIFYDDASTDNTSILLESAGYKVIKGALNQGPGYARNRLAEAAASQYIHFHDIDDEFHPDFFDEFISSITKNPLQDVYVADAEWINSSNRNLIIKFEYKNEAYLINDKQYIINHPMGIINVVYKKVVFDEVGGFNEKYKCWEDTDLHVRMMLKGYKFYFLERVLAYSLRHEEGISKNQQYCWQCRLLMLISYYDTDHSLAGYLLPQLRICAKELFIHHDINSCREAIKFINTLGHSAIGTQSRYVKILKLFNIPDFFIIRLQHQYAQMRKRY
ncbi:MAG: glycosyltransferase family A protein [Cytophagales bacterium]|nr:glycosyltransferase family A protein [Cytophagales bacterium]